MNDLNKIRLANYQHMARIGADVSFHGTIGYYPLGLNTFYEEQDSSKKYVITKGLTTLIKNFTDASIYISKGWSLLGIYDATAHPAERQLTPEQQAYLDNKPPVNPVPVPVPENPLPVSPVNPVVPIIPTPEIPSPEIPSPEIPSPDNVNTYPTIPDYRPLPTTGGGGGSYSPAQTSVTVESTDAGNFFDKNKMLIIGAGLLLLLLTNSRKN